MDEKEKIDNTHVSIFCSWVVTIFVNPEAGLDIEKRLYSACEEELPTYK